MRTTSNASSIQQQLSATLPWNLSGNRTQNHSQTHIKMVGKWGAAYFPIQ